MSRYAVTWVVGPSREALDLDPARPYVIGREPSCEVVLDHPTVSRRQARLRGDGSRVTIENLSATNPTKLAGVPIDQIVGLDDGAMIHAGEIPISFWDLASGDRLSGPRCSHCERENVATDTECWFCGTSLVNASTTMRSKLRVVCRLIGVDGAHDLLDDGVLAFGPDGSVLPRRGTDDTPRPSIAAQDGGARFLGQGSATLAGVPTVPGEPSRPLITGDHIVIDGVDYVAIAR